MRAALQTVEDGFRSVGNGGYNAVLGKVKKKHFLYDFERFWGSFVLFLEFFWEMRRNWGNLKKVFSAKLSPDLFLKMPTTENCKNFKIVNWIVEKMQKVNQFFSFFIKTPPKSLQIVPNSFKLNPTPGAYNYVDDNFGKPYALEGAKKLTQPLVGRWRKMKNWKNLSFWVFVSGILIFCAFSMIFVAFWRFWFFWNDIKNFQVNSKFSLFQIF